MQAQTPSTQVQLEITRVEKEIELLSQEKLCYEAQIVRVSKSSPFFLDAPSFFYVCDKLLPTVTLCSKNQREREGNGPEMEMHYWVRHWETGLYFVVQGQSED